MALTPLATVADLDARGIDTTNATRAAALLDEASAEVRDAAGVPITQETFTVAILGTREQWLRLPGQPVSTVSAIDIDGTAVTDHELIGGELWRLHGWQPTWWKPSKVTITITGGLAEVPADIVGLVCSMVGAAMASAEDGYESKAGIAYESIDDYRVGYEQGESRMGVMELPESTRARLRARFGGGAALVVSK